jgi:hypothetical protein
MLHLSGMKPETVSTISLDRKLEIERLSDADIQNVKPLNEQFGPPPWLAYRVNRKAAIRAEDARSK